MSRIVGGEWYLDNRAKEVFRRQIGRVSAFCGVEVLTFCIMSNHFHLLIRIPEHREVTDKELLKLFSELHGERHVRVSMLAAALKEDGPYRKAWRRRLRARMGDVSIFMKELKQRFSIWYNRSHRRFGRKGSAACRLNVGLLRCRVRYFTDGAVLGSSEYVQEQFEAFRQFLGEHWTSGPRCMRGGDWGGLTVLRNLQKDVIT